MSTHSTHPDILHSDREQSDYKLAASLTKEGSSQTYQIFQTLVDRSRLHNAFRAYGYFRWLDDTLDLDCPNTADRIALIERQMSLVEASYRGQHPDHLAPQEEMLVNLIHSDQEPDCSLPCYIRNMMAMMAFDAGRRGRLISQEELKQYTHWLAVGVTENLHYFIGHGARSPHDETRYLAVTAAHITHMLRDTLEDIQMGYFNIPREYLELHRISPYDVESEPYRKWVERRVLAARAFFRVGRGYIARVESLRFRLAAYIYTERFETTLETIEQDGYRLRTEYPAAQGTSPALKVMDSFLRSAFMQHRHLSSQMSQREAEQL